MNTKQSHMDDISQPVINKRGATMFLILAALIGISVVSLSWYWYGWKLAVVLFLFGLFIKMDFMGLPGKWKQ